jgi:glyoxylase-like metal-dependent hydrolase (beta-lactamase superfamily II)
LSEPARVHDLGAGCYAYVQGDGSWGWSNAGLVTDGGAALLVDTLYDLKLTRRMLDAFRAATPTASNIETVVNTHGNGDHWYGNQLLKGATIVATRAAAEEMAEVPPAKMATTLRTARTLSRLPWPLGAIPAGRGLASLRQLGHFLMERFGAFEFEDIALALPTSTFSGAMTCRVGEKEVRLIEVGPAHTRGDLLACVPAARVVFAGDILFHGGHPIVWAGPVRNWIRALDLILDMDVDVVVPGHGPLADKAAVRAEKRYLEHVAAEARKGFDAGKSVLRTAQDMDLGEFAGWGEGERIVANVDALYREFRGGGPAPHPRTVAAMMAKMAVARRGPTAAGSPGGNRS